MEEVLVFPSTHYMLRAEGLLKRGGYLFRLVPAPPQAGERCTTAIAVSARDREEIVRRLEEERVLVTAVLPHEGRLERKLAEAVGKAARLGASPALERALAALHAGRRPGADAMLVERIDIEHVEPCFADETKIRLIARIPVDVSELMPYLNAVLANASYVRDRPALTFTKGPRLVTVYPRKVTIAKADDIADAEETLAWLCEKINHVHERREEIEPVYEGKIKIMPLDIYGLLPQTNCHECGEHSCLAFALLLLQEKHRLSDCGPLCREERYAAKLRRLREVLDALGLA
ncbi:MAG: DUF3343 domain-containing protein [Actinobacteria bacterium]|nr:DUF3343 domain-containing protein [Actinomycetota bacterium]